jgi:GntR family transcriptional regulator
VTWDFDRNRPIYLQIGEEICRRIVRGDLPPGARTPSVRELAAELRVNPNTVQRAYQELERNGVLFARRGQGSFVREDPALVGRLRQQIAAAAARRYWTEVAALGMSPEEARRLIAGVIHDDKSSLR